jgi:hypothetical protein
MGPMPCKDWHAMLQLLCRDLPSSVTEGAFLAATAAEAVSNSRATHRQGGVSGNVGAGKAASSGAGAGAGAGAGSGAGAGNVSGDGSAGEDGGSGGLNGPAAATTLDFPALFPALQIAILYRKFLDQVRERVFMQSDFTVGRFTLNPGQPRLVSALETKIRQSAFKNPFNVHRVPRHSHGEH